jgi:NAD(P)-dependent dehydrogenase (short-subunit alcohol dehydrogenase family)
MSQSSSPHSGRTYAVTGAGSGIGAAVAKRLRDEGARVITCDLAGADVAADLSTAAGRATLAEGVARLSGGRLDGVVANAGGGRPETLVALNFFGAVATLDGLRPLLEAGAAPRAVAVSSISSLGPPDTGLIDACLAGDEPAAIAAAGAALAAGKGPLDLYGAAKHALNQWCRMTASQAPWAGAGITLNVVAPGVVDTPAAAYILTDPDRRAQMQGLEPLRGAYPARPDQMAAILAWCVSPENALMTGQVLFADGGFECRARGETSW